MRTEKINIYKFEELSDTAKERAREEFKKYYPDYDWYEDIYSDFIKKVKKYGFDLEPKDIMWSGFSCQGDGASFTCERLHKKVFLKYANINVKHGLEKVFLDGTTMEIERNGSRYCHKNSVTVAVCYYDIGCDSSSAQYEAQKRNRIDSYLNEVSFLVEKKLIELKDNLCEELYRKLEKRYYSLLSDENIDEEITCNEYEFYEDGRQYL